MLKFIANKKRRSDVRMKKFEKSIVKNKISLWGIIN